MLESESRLHFGRERTADWLSYCRNEFDNCILVLGRIACDCVVSERAPSIR